MTRNVDDVTTTGVPVLNPFESVPWRTSSRASALSRWRSITEYWIVNLVNDVFEIHRDPKDGTYHDCIVLKPADTVSSLAFPDLESAVSDLLP